MAELLQVEELESEELLPSDEELLESDELLLSDDELESDEELESEELLLSDEELLESDELLLTDDELELDEEPESEELLLSDEELLESDELLLTDDELESDEELVDPGPIGISQTPRPCVAALSLRVVACTAKSSTADSGRPCEKGVHVHVLPVFSPFQTPTSVPRKIVFGSLG